MNEEMPVVDCHLSKDLEFARNLARQMKEGYGRHNSNLAFRNTLQRARLGGVPYSDIPTPTDIQDALTLAWHQMRENQQVRVIGRIGDNALRERWQDCEIGDAVPEDKMPPISATMAREYGSRYIVMRTPRPLVSRIRPAMEPDTRQETYVRFEKVRHTVTSDGGYTWQEETLWKRIE
jgi:hypothetical protein